MDILITKRKQMRKLFIRTLALALCLTGTVQALRAQETTVAGTTATSDERPKTINEMRRERGLTDTHNLFVPKGQWIFGGTASYSTHTNKGYQFLIIEGINSKGYTFRVSPMIAYAFRDNMALGGRFIYSRTLLKLDAAELHFGDEESGTNIVAKDSTRSDRPIRLQRSGGSTFRWGATSASRCSTRCSFRPEARRHVLPTTRP